MFLFAIFDELHLRLQDKILSFVLKISKIEIYQSN